MDKKKLRSLRTLNATPAMMQKAVTDVGKEMNWNKKMHKFEHYLYLRCQNLKGIIKVAVFCTENMKLGAYMAEYEIFLNPEGEEFITWDVKDKKWRESMLDNLIGWWEVREKADKKAWINSEGLKTLRTKLDSDKDAFGAIVEFQRRVREKQAERKRKRETDPWDRDMEKIPELPKDWDNWCSRHGVREHFIFYEYTKKGAKEGYCSYCGKWVPIKQPRHNKGGTCPSCRTKIEFKASGKITTLSTENYIVQLLQKTVTGFCLRKFEVHRSYGRTSFDKPILWQREYERILYENGKEKRYYYEIYKNIEMRWCGKSGQYSYWSTRGGLVYTRNIHQLARTVLSRSALPVILKQNKRLDVEWWIRKEKYNPVIEMAAKSGCYRLAKEIAECSYDKELLKKDATELARILKIDNSRLKRLRKADGGIQMLLWLQQEKKEDTVYEEDMLMYYYKNNIGPKDLEFMKDRMTNTQIYHYMVRQQKLCGDSARQLLRTWGDYLNMAKRAKMQLTSEIIFKPKNLTEKHGEMVAFFQRGKIEEEAKRWEKKFKNVNKHCQELGKYEYKDKKYMIVAPKSITDIVREGTILQHCIHTTDIYFDRIERKETFLLFLRRASAPDTPYYTLEVEPGGNIRQKRTVRDTQTREFEDALSFLKNWQQEVQKRITKEDRELGRKSNDLRQQEYKKLYQEQKRVWHGALAGKLLAEVLENDFMGVEELKQEAL